MTLPAMASPMAPEHARVPTAIVPPAAARRPGFRGRRGLDRLRDARLTHRWRYKLAPDPLKRKPKGVLPFWTRARRLFWSWWPWALAFLWNLAHDKWGWTIGTGLMALVCYLIAPVESPPQYGLDHEFAIDDEEFLPTMAGATGVAFLPGNALTILNNGDAFYPAMLKAIAEAEVSITIEAYIYWDGEIGRQFADALAAKAKAGLRVKILLDAVGSFVDRRRRAEDSRRRRLPAGLVQPVQLAASRALQPPHPPQVADRRRPGRVHRRRRHRRSLARRREEPRRVARPADPRRGTGGHAAADRVRAELAADHRRADLGAALLPAERARGHAGAAVDHELARNRRLDRADHVLPLDHLRAALDPASPIPISCPTRPRATR